ncbi:hypothetical protein LZY01_11430 [Levilactobacillus zymae]|uniref:Uncharacterized protein n=1 Tax=Levilactobacillus zymae TaxID=267363 RepID=A0ABQ0WVX7_9LACO|nr:hypothetical protein LZY01_11430 [Levilactobacillus zymae]
MAGSAASWGVDVAAEDVEVAADDAGVTDLGALLAGADFVASVADDAVIVVVSASD